MQCVRAFFSCRRMCKQMFVSDSEMWIKLEGDTGVVVSSFDFNGTNIYLRCVYRDADIKVAVVRSPDWEQQNMFGLASPPWMAIYAGNIDMTAEMSELVVPGNVITPQVLRYYSGDPWRILTSSFEEVPFPDTLTIR